MHLLMTMLFIVRIKLLLFERDIAVRFQFHSSSVSTKLISYVQVRHRHLPCTFPTGVLVRLPRGQPTPANLFDHAVVTCK